ncbi:MULTISPECIES: ShlB/FhaC/HecB family hemolysin secretion/activation protein [unclassified Pseudomonas]|uniref:ShlB/FhaC/HecB family hemolysin secretion/activation protein n=1 Tax=unclassified Pseudomonas TaxID=196821 RepID=UPI002096F28F|nr:MULTISPECIES: ShlB/FhaC/HecB family hemolysin secretion/activation protein [unclassified Pseudomonas]MCO7520971.1 ShlB/FhaC/HecB family hemolysin secretion/activation protein [Pseudomonas sp. 1]MCO7542057.1 ShlB/FhaC/HecB family hemolysin secretion/activation protein [Pseudomonas sp. VA159-2]
MSRSFRAGATGLALLPLLAGAAPFQSPGDRDLIRDRQENLLQEQRKRLEELQQLPGKQAPQAPTQPSEDDRCFQIERIDLQGATLLSEGQRHALLADDEGQCLPVARFNALLKRITDHYLDRGYLTTRAYLPQQDLGSGVLQIIVVEGRLEGLDSSSLASPRELAMTFPGRVGEVLDLRQMEQMVDQLGRLPSRRAEVELVPGQVVGGSRVQLKGERDKPWRVSASRHNNGDASSGEQQMNLGFEWDSPLGLADQLNLRSGRDVVSDQWRHSDSQGLNYNLPWGWWTFNYSYNRNYYRTRDTSSGFPFKLDGDNAVHQFQAERVIHRDSLSKTAVNLGISHLRARNYLDDTLIDVSSTRITERQLGVNHGRRIGNAFVNLDAGWQQGIGALDAQGAGDPHGNEPVARYNKYTLTLSYLQPFQLWGEQFSFDSLATGQRSEDALYSGQRISVGGLTSVRGFKEQTLTGDSGGYWRNQLRWRRPVTWAPLQPWLREYGMAVAYDAGVIKGQHGNGQDHGRLSGNAFEFNARGQYFAASATFARSLQRPDVITRREHPIYFRVDAFF